ncbi:grasp-with-spasm system ATP-grasp peptide maturase [Flavobacterium sp. CAU 1735]|uniref:grasp-with-spasm system ATP-grasp peptide maturase n=1 Tax=Flavobacterium sp. CAU 1735 TaxID=3140361 RepID=UPI0032601F5D
MVLILSAPDDLSTNDVIDWLRYYDIPFLRISVNDIITYKSVTIGNSQFNIEFSINEKSYNLHDFTAFWYRRSHYSIFIGKIIENNILDRQINRHLQVETNEIHKLFTNYIRKKSINNHHDLTINKLDVLKLATTFGLNIPDTLIATKKTAVSHFMRKHSKIITKNFSQGIFIHNKNESFNSTTNIVTKKIFNLLPKDFFPSLFQEHICKLFELRIFYLMGTFYSSAIFSQNDPKTSVDFRNYNKEKPNRTPPFKLPRSVEIKLVKLMKALKLNSGSIDMLVSVNSEYVFLEVNPIGQFGQVSKPCNYYLEKQIAKELNKISKYGTSSN